MINTIFFENDLLSEDVVKEQINTIENSFNKNLSNIKKILISHGVDIKRLQLDSRSLANRFKLDVKEKKDPRILGQDISKGIHRIVVNQEKSITNVTDNDMRKAIHIFLCIMVVITIFQVLTLSLVAVGFISEMSSFVLTSVVFAPILEEAGKHIAITQNVPWVYTGIFAGAEAIIYIIRYAYSGIPFITLLIARAVAFGLHFALTYIQKYFYDKSVKEKDETLAHTGYITAVGLHALYNTLAIAAVIK